jgi:hypothetical protein
VITANMQIRNIGVVGYAIVFPAVTPLIARVFSRKNETATDARPDRADIEASELTTSNGHRTLAASSVDPLP